MATVSTQIIDPSPGYQPAGLPQAVPLQVISFAGGLPLAGGHIDVGIEVILMVMIFARVFQG